jgi:transposase
MLIIGADVCKSSVVFCCLDSENPPLDPSQYYRNGDNFQVASANIHGLKMLLDRNPSVIAMEPTGDNYSRIWAEKLAEAGVTVVMIPHSECKSYRQIWGLPDKDDAADALALGLYYIQHKDNPRRFVVCRDQVTSKLRGRILRLQHLVRLQNMMINRLRQDLAYCFPERQDTKLEAPLFWGWVAGDRKSLRYDQELANSIGLGITEDVQIAAKALCANLQRELTVLSELNTLLQEPQFRPYREVLSRYGIGARGQALIISQIYPIENFLDENKKPIVERSKGRFSKKPTLKHLSERRFMKMLGLAPTREQSGSSINITKKAGSGLCRTAFWLWCFTRIEPTRNRLKGEMGDKLRGRFDELLCSCPRKLARSKFCAYAARRIFYDLVAEIAKD